MQTFFILVYANSKQDLLILNINRCIIIELQITLLKDATKGIEAYPFLLKTATSFSQFLFVPQVLV